MNSEIFIICFPANQANGSRGFLGSDGSEIILNNDAVKMLTKWNKDCFLQSPVIDRIFVEYLMIILIGTVKIMADDMDPEKINLIKGKETFLL